MTYEEAVTEQNRHEWLQAIEEEKKSLIENNTWEEVDRQEAGEAKILNKWVLRIKNDGCYKARLVVCGNQQEYGIDFTETYSPDVSCLRILLAVAAARNYTIFGFDIKTAFLCGKLEETIFMNMPKGYPHADKICKLKKSLYGLKQAPIKWNELFTSFLRKNGLKALETQRCIFKNDDGTLILAIYVDDGILIGNNFALKFSKKKPNLLWFGTPFVVNWNRSSFDDDCKLQLRSGILGSISINEVYKIINTAYDSSACDRKRQSLEREEEYFFDTAHIMYSSEICHMKVTTKRQQ
ncbi:hypothetical protein Trydic_g13174 [Trypoxylus dichotomus]